MGKDEDDDEEEENDYEDINTKRSGSTLQHDGLEYQKSAKDQYSEKVKKRSNKSSNWLGLKNDQNHANLKHEVQSVQVKKTKLNFEGGDVEMEGGTLRKSQFFNKDSDSL